MELSDIKGYEKVCPFCGKKFIGINQVQVQWNYDVHVHSHKKKKEEEKKDGD